MGQSFACQNSWIPRASDAPAPALASPPHHDTANLHLSIESASRSSRLSFPEHNQWTGVAKHNSHSVSPSSSATAREEKGGSIPALGITRQVTLRDTTLLRGGAE